jgi:6-phosphogluconolactonase
MVFSEDGRHACVVNELDSTISASEYNEASGQLSVMNHVATLPEGVVVSNATAEIAIHPNGKYLYASNRGHDSIAVFARDDVSGRLPRILIAPASGQNPRHFAVSPDGRWLLCAHQDSSTIAALPLDPTSGMVGEARARIHCPKPICVHFLRDVKATSLISS